MFKTFSTSIDTGFWAALSDLKMTKLKLDSTPQRICALYLPASAAAHRSEGDGGTGLAAVTWMNLQGEALDMSFETSRRYVRAGGTVTVVNTMDEFKDIDKNAFLNKAGAQMCADIDSGAAEQDPSLLVRCEGVIFSDLKNYKHVYWFAFPALCPPVPPVLVGAPLSLSARLPSLQQRQQIHHGVLQLQETNRAGAPPFFLLELCGADVTARPLSDLQAVAAGSNEWWLAFVDPSHLATNPGWPLRNALYLLQQRVKLAAATVLCYRDVLDAKEPPHESRRLLTHAYADVRRRMLMYAGVC
jgi:ubiquitin-like modifier-activating enzyme ATG7